MVNSRRQFLTRTSSGLLGATTTAREIEESTDLPAGAPPTFGTAPAVGPEVSRSTFAEAEKLVRVKLSSTDRSLAARSWRTTMAGLYERRTGPRKVVLEPTVAPWSRWQAALPNEKAGPYRERFIRSKIDPGPLPASDKDLAFAPLTQLSRWIETGNITSQRLTKVYLDRLHRFNPKLRCAITLTPELAFAQAKRADEEITAGKYRGPLHGILWGAKDLMIIYLTKVSHSGILCSW